MPERYEKNPDNVSRLTREQYHVTQENGTEPAFANEFWDNKDAGLTSTLFLASRCLLRLRSSTAIAAGRASLLRSSRPTWSRRRTTPTG